MSGIRLVLYVAGGSPNSMAARRNLERLLEAHPRAPFTLDVVDVLRAPDAALAARIIATPTLVAYVRDPPVRLIGTLEDAAVVAAALALESVTEQGAS